VVTSSPTRHVNVDRTHKLIRRYAVTDAAVHDSRKLNGLLHRGNTSQDVFGDPDRYRGRRKEQDGRIKASLTL
jgi:IS5 family transposase